MKPGDKIEVDFTFDCPFCGQLVAVEKPTESKIGVLHTEPLCELFDKLDPEEFIHECHLKMGLTELN